MLKEYSFCLFYLVVSFCLGCVIFFLSYLFVFRIEDYEKISSYECGFDSFGDARNKFDVRFYLVAILFIIFDLEIVFLFPVTVVFSHMGLWGIFVVFFFLLILVIGFVYEWMRGALEW